MIVALGSLESVAEVFSKPFHGSLHWRRLARRLRKQSWLSLLVLLCLSAYSPTLFGQVTGGTLTGTVSDPGGSVVPEAVVVATNLGTNSESRTKTTSAGLYVLPNLPAGIYTLSVEIAGFQKYVRTPIEVSQGRTIGVDVTLQVGRVTELIEVKAQAPLLDTATSEIGHQVSSRFVKELPLVAGGDVRDPERFMFILPGVSGDSWNAHVNGGQAFTKEITVDGVSNNLSTVQGSFFENSPPYEALAEFKLDTSNYSAEYGSAQAGITQYQLKSGTNNFHGSVFSSIRNEVMNANDILSNMGLSGEPPDAHGNAFKPPDKSWGIAASAGGPVYIPHVYDGKNKTFIFSAFEGATSRRGVFGARNTFPVQDFLQGNFSSLLGGPVGTDCLGRTVLSGQIYDPTTTRQATCTDGSEAFVRDPFLNNQVPIRSSIANNLLHFFPSIPGPQTTGNFAGTNGDLQVRKDIQYWLIKLDQTISQRHKLSASFNLTRRPREDTNGGGLPPPNPLTNWDNQKVTTKNGRLAYDFTLRPNLLNHFTFGYSRFNNPHFYINFHQDISQFGFKGLPRLDQGLPPISFASEGSFGYQSIGGAAPKNQVIENNFLLTDNLTWIKGRHSFKYGVEFRANRLNNHIFDSVGGSSGSFKFSPRQTRLPGFAQTGDPFASFLLGAVNTFQASEEVDAAARRRRFSWFVQDDYKVTRKLTLNIGLRHDIQYPTYDANNRSESFVPTLPNPGAGGLPGAIAYAGRGGFGRRFADTWYKGFGPRFGFAYAMTDKTVLRGAYGIFMGGSGFDDFFGIFNRDFYFTVDCSEDLNHRDPVFFIDDGPPANCLTPARQTADVENGKSLNATTPPGHIPKTGGLLPYVQQWSFGIQRQLTTNMSVDVNYVGAKGTHLHNEAIDFINQLDPRFISLGSLRSKPIGDPTVQALPEVQAFPVDPATGNHSPFAGFEALYGGGAILSQALRPFPQFRDIGTNLAPVGNSNYNSFQLSLTRRFSQGLSFITAYTISKTIGDSEQNLSGFNAYWNGTNLGTNTYDRRSERSVLSYDQPQLLTISAAYELPAGRGKRWLNRRGAVNQVLGGWQLAGTAKYARGFPMAVSQCDAFGCLGNGTIYNWLGGEASLSNPNIVQGQPLKNPSYNGTYQSQYVNPKAFTESFDTFGNAPRLLSRLRTPGQLAEDLSLLKTFPITEKVRFQFRTEFFNAFNRHRFAPSFTNYADTFIFFGGCGFGAPGTGCTLSTLADSPRAIQFSGRLDW